MSTTNTVNGCIDCMHLIEFGVPANSDWTEEQVAEHRAAIDHRFPTERLVYAGSEEEDTTFSSTPCQCCGSTLGGTRHVIAYFEAVQR